MISSIFLHCLISATWALQQKSSQSSQDIIWPELQGGNVRKPRLAIVSAQYGERDKSVSLTDLAEGIQGFFFTDNTDLKQGSAGRGWTVVHRPYHLEGWCSLDTHGKYSMSTCKIPIARAVIAAKFYKMNAYLVDELKDIDMILWTDASNVGRHALLDGRCGEDLASRADKLLGSSDFVAQQHPKRTRVQEEIGAASFRAALQTKMVEDELRDDMVGAVLFMESQGFKDDIGLLHGESFLYRTKSPAVRAALSYWWTLNQNYTFRDQISYPWALRFNKVKFTVPCKSGGIKGQSCLPELLSEGPFSVGETDECPRGYRPITTQLKCGIASEKLGYIWDPVLYHPAGVCNYCETCTPKAVRFNRHFSERKWLCEPDGCMQAHLYQKTASTNVDACASGWIVVDTNAECQSAAAALGQIYMRSDSWANGPFGCFESYSGHIYFNAYVGGPGNKKRKLVCKKA